MIRGDLSNKLIHLTRGASDEEVINNFHSILSGKVLRGSDRDIRGRYKCVCFSEAPLNLLTHALASPERQGMRYRPFGIMVSKKWLFDKGGRPVIYQPEEEYELLPDALRYRHVRYEPNRNIDFAWEREWRIKTDSLSLLSDETTVVVPTRDWAEKFHADHTMHDAITSSLVGRHCQLNFSTR